MSDTGEELVINYTGTYKDDSDDLQRVMSRILRQMGIANYKLTVSCCQAVTESSEPDVSGGTEEQRSQFLSKWNSMFAAA